MPSFGRHPRDGTYLFAGGPAMDESDIIYENGASGTARDVAWPRHRDSQQLGTT